MKLHFVMPTKRGRKGALDLFHVVGDVENLLTHLLLRHPAAPPSRQDFRVDSRDNLYLDPGGGLLMEEPLDFEVEGLSCSIRPHKLAWQLKELQESKEATFAPGWVRVPQTRSWLYFPTSFREPLLCALMALEFVDGVKESRERAQALSDGIHLAGHSARPAEGGGFHVVRQDSCAMCGQNAHWFDPEAQKFYCNLHAEGVQADLKSLDDEDFTVPEGIEPF